MSDADAHTFVLNYIVVVSLLFLVGIILTLVKLRSPKRQWKRCVHGHWATREAYCPECGLYLSPVPKAQQQRIEYTATHEVALRAIGDPVMRYHFALWLVELEQQAVTSYMIDVAVTMYKSNWRVRALEIEECR